MFEVTLTIGDKEFKSKGETLFEALMDINPGKTDITYKGIFVIKKNKKIHEQLMFVAPLRRFFFGDLPRKIWAKRWEVAMNEFNRD